MTKSLEHFKNSFKSFKVSETSKTIYPNYKPVCPCVNTFKISRSENQRLKHNKYKYV